MESEQIFSSPDYSERSYYVQTVTFDGKEYVAILPNLAEGKELLISEEVFHTIKAIWDGGGMVILSFGNGILRPDDVIVAPDVIAWPLQ